MKQSKARYFFSLIIVILLSSCIGAKDKLSVCTYKDDDVTFKMEYTSKGTKLLKEKAVYNYTLNDETLTNIVAKSYILENQELYRDINGASFKGSITEKTLEEIFVLDYREVDMKQLVDKEIVSKVEGKIPNAIDIDLTIKSMESLGAKCEVVNEFD